MLYALFPVSRQVYCSQFGNHSLWRRDLLCKAISLAQKSPQAGREFLPGRVRSIVVNDRRLEKAAGRAVSGSVPVRKPFIHAGRGHPSCSSNFANGGESRGAVVGRYIPQSRPVVVHKHDPTRNPRVINSWNTPAFGIAAGVTQAVPPSTEKDHAYLYSMPVLLLFSGSESGTLDSLNNCWFLTPICTVTRRVSILRHRLATLSPQAPSRATWFVEE